MSFHSKRIAETPGFGIRIEAKSLNAIRNSERKGL
jgi:hypothetical protein